MLRVLTISKIYNKKIFEFVKYSALVDMAKPQEVASASPPHERVPDISQYKCNTFLLYFAGIKLNINSITYNHMARIALRVKCTFSQKGSSDYLLSNTCCFCYKCLIGFI